MIIKGDKVSVLDDAIDGVVLEIKGNEVTIETSDGFTLIFKIKKYELRFYRIIVIELLIITLFRGLRNMILNFDSIKRPI